MSPGPDYTRRTPSRTTPSSSVFRSVMIIIMIMIKTIIIIMIIFRPVAHLASPGPQRQQAQVNDIVSSSGPGLGMVTIAISSLGPGPDSSNDQFSVKLIMQIELY